MGNSKISTLTRKIESDGAILKSAISYFGIAKHRVLKASDDQVSRLMRGESTKSYQITYYRDRVIALDEEALQARNQLVELCVNRLGNEYGNRDDVVNLIAKTLSGLAIDPTYNPASIELAKIFRSALLDLVQQEFRIIAPNLLFRFFKDPMPMHFDTVSMLPPDELNESIGENLFIVGDQYMQRIDGSRVSIEMPAMSWMVSVQASAGNAIREAAWAIDAAVSLIRLTCLPYCRLNPGIGDVEPLSMASSEPMLDPIRERESEVSVSMSASSIYLIDEPFVNYANSQYIQRVTRGVMSANRDTCGYYLKQGLGWLTRGRQVRDHAFRVLLFFTALETILTRPSVLNPVSDTLARHVASILTEDIDQRPGIARTIKDLYRYRSKVVHEGARDVTQTQSNAIQYYAETVFAKLIPELPLEKPMSEFWKALDHAGYGLNWRDILYGQCDDL